MTNPFLPSSNDLSVKFVSPSSPTDPRTVLAEEFSLNSQLAITLFQSNRQSGWVEDPEITVTSARRIRIKGKVSLAIYPKLVEVNHEISIPNLPDTTSTVRREDQISIVGLAAEVGEEQDLVLGQVGFKYEDTITNTIKDITKENARRYRAFWLAILHTGNITASNIWELLPANNLDGKRLTITNTSNTGFVLGAYRIYAIDSLLKAGTYTVIPESIEVISVGRILRLQNYEEDGYSYGYQLESTFVPEINITHKFKKLEVNSNIEQDIRRSLREIITGKKRQGSYLKKAVLNLIAGTSASPNRRGIIANSPNNSICIANDQRISFSNQQILSNLAVTWAIANANENGQSLVGVGLNTNSPAGSFFSENRENHKIYSLDGREQSSFGQFSGLGSNGSLQWAGQNNSTINPGDEVLFVPAIRYPSGSGLNIPILEINAAWINGLPISAANIRHGMSHDLNAYEAPANNESFIIIYGTERAAIHYIYKRISIQTTNQGVLAIPRTERGCFAFIQGVSGRIDKPVVTGLQPSVMLNCLIYYPPRTGETWQIEGTYSPYQGLGQLEASNFLNGATVISRPLCFSHTSGGGLSVHQGDAELAMNPISFHLPKLFSGIPHYEFDAPVFFPNEPYPGPITWREVEALTADGLMFPTPGQKINFIPSGLLSRSISGSLNVGGKNMGYKIIPINNSSSFQSVLIFAVEKDKERKMVIATQNCSSLTSINIELDSSKQTAFDLFNI
jgi:hypothetical protein